MTLVGSSTEALSALPGTGNNAAEVGEFTPSVVLPRTKRQSLIDAHIVLCKLRLNAMVVFTTALGFAVGSQMIDPPGINWLRLLWTCLGTLLAAMGASAFNQAIEARRDARMHRTRNRPLCTGRLTRTYAATLGLILSICGVALLCPTSNGLTACLAATNVLIYIAIYTPLKPVSSINTLVGAIVGGIPPVLGWTAATGYFTAGAIVLGAILFIWQIPHFLALAWLYREDYARGGFRMLPVIDRSGKLTGRLALIYTLILIPLCLLLSYLGHAGLVFAAVSFILTMSMLAVVLRFTLTRSNADARAMFIASIIYLPLLGITLMANARSPMFISQIGSEGIVLPSPNQPAFVDPESVPPTNAIAAPSVTPVAPTTPAASDNTIAPSKKP